MLQLCSNNGYYQPKYDFLRVQGRGIGCFRTSVHFNDRELNYRINKRNLSWPVPNDAITANSEYPLAQNYGYNGYSADQPMWMTWEEAVENE